MIEIIQIFKELGSTAIDLFWLPIAIWTVAALMAAVLLNYAHKLAAVYQYHFRVALLAALPAGIVAAPLIHALFSSGTKSAGSGVFFVIQNPISISATATTQAGIAWSDPALWVGTGTVFVGLIALAALVKLLFDFIRLKWFIKQLQGKPAEQIDKNVTVYLSEAVETPCTFGRSEKSIVIPVHLKDQPEKYNMALRHELMHIQHNDYAINNFLQVIKALFFFHPAVHHFIHQANEYREIFCDIKVLSDARISQKSYAGLLYELATKPVFKNITALNMAVNPSTLKKRIQMMKKQAKITPSLKKSVMVALFLGLTLTGFMACSDMTSDGITTTEVKKMQKNMATSSDVNFSKVKPLVVINGEIMGKGTKNIPSRIKPKYIKSINVLKGEAATKEYGQKGQNGVIEIQVYNKEKALSNLKSLQEVKNAVIKSNGKKVYVSTDHAPKLLNKKAFYTGVEYPQQCKQAGIEGTVYVQFVITKTGDITNASVVRGIGGGCDKYAVNYVKEHARFAPGTQNGKPVNVKFTLPIMFRLN